MQDYDWPKVLEEVVTLARAAGAAIKAVATSGDLQTQAKADTSPVTAADLAANEVIIKGLQQLTPDIPIVSEESPKLAEGREKSRVIWLVDPLDGTAAFVDNGDDYTVNIGLIVDTQPLLGAVYVPAQDMTYWGLIGEGAWRQKGSESPIALQTKPSRKPPVVASSRRHLDPDTSALLKGLGEYIEFRSSSSIKLCYVADGQVDLYPRLGNNMEWDTAAADAVIRAAGGQVLCPDDWQPLRYNKPDLYSLPFVAFADPALLKQLKNVS
ncbi:MAG TPA: 3'(2'),5'-bisphosphate nucleotidase CysQ [Candidatus Saccharimonadales bacterium]|nr:3'(2'),5'-bisphosphate nucleotidase CysQ [Candidatus Saccharimonadales bacterium]